MVWINTAKLFFILVLALYFIQTKEVQIPQAVLLVLLYLCFNLTGSIAKGPVLQRLALFAALSAAASGFFTVHPLFIILMPLNFLELAAPASLNKWLALLLLLLPVSLISQSVQLFYFLAALFSFLVYILAESYEKRVQRLEYHNDKMRRDLILLTKNLNENTEYSRQLHYSFKLEERNRLSQEIHDKIGHSMTGALIQMEAAKHLLDKDAEKARELLQNAIHISKEGIESIRLTLKNMKPPAEQMGLSRIRLLAEEFSATHRISVQLVHKGNIEAISQLQWKVIYDNMAEGMTNTLRYADADCISVRLEVLHKVVKAEIKDNGKGAEKVEKGLGLIGMEERTASAGGTIVFHGKDGFTITMLLPIANVWHG
ncbi:histidine kinase [Metabacillus sp. GX 13764]|nr:histidine kinase [Metabacillus kandeliae]MCD7035634.1 histidine kinase [Metabacillus kandeliae]